MVTKTSTKKPLTKLSKMTLGLTISYMLYFGIVYFFQMQRGVFSIKSIVLLMVLCAFGGVLGMILLIREQGSSLAKILIFITIFVMWVGVFFFGRTNTIFSMLYPIMIIYTLYGRIAFISVISFLGGVVLLTKGMSGRYGEYMWNSQFINQLISMVLISCTSILTTWYFRDSSNSIEMTLETVRKRDAEKSRILKISGDAVSVIKENIGKIDIAIFDITNSATIISKSSKEISAGSTSNAQNVLEQSVLINDIKALIQMAIDESVDIKNHALKENEIISSGVEILGELHCINNSVTEQNDIVNDMIKSLKNKADIINTQTDSINNIATQTNLLALNAAIESARAGEVGKGFAVVAEEIRKLAIESSKISHQISDMVLELKVESDQSFNAMSVLNQASGKQSDFINRNINVFADINGISSKNQLKIDNISCNILEISKVNSKINNGNIEISSISEQTMACAQESNAMTIKNLEKTQDITIMIKDIGQSIDELNNTIY